MATWHFWRHQKSSHTDSIQDSANTISLNTYCVIAKSNPQNVFPPAFTYCLKLGTALFCGNFSIVVPNATCNSETLFLASDEAFKKLRSSLSRHNICRERFKFGELDGHFLPHHSQPLLNNTTSCSVHTVHRDPCISPNLPLKPAAVGCSLQYI